jgi:hypothetical protein
MSEDCVGCVYHAKKNSGCALRVCKGKTIITPEGYLRKVSKKDIPCNSCKTGVLNTKTLQMECTKYVQITETETGMLKVVSLGCNLWGGKHENA